MSNVPRLSRMLAIALLLGAGSARAFDHGHGAWDELLRRTVVVLAPGNASQVRYADMLKERAALRRYLDQLSAVDTGEYGNWPRPQQLAFLIHAYNAFTVELILGSYPKLGSIRDLGGFFQSPWKRKFFRLLGSERHLDEIEHDLIRAPGVFDEARIHVALVCASVGCPMLRNEAFVAGRLETQLEDSLRRFLSDRSRNRFDGDRGVLWLSKLFDWYGRDFAGPRSRYATLQERLKPYANVLADDAASRARIQAGDYRIDFLDYDWTLNDVR